MSRRALRAARVVAIRWAIQMVVVAAVLAQSSSSDYQRQVEREVTTATANVLALESRVTALERAGTAERLAKLEAVAEDARDTRRLLYGVIGGVAVQLLLSAMQLKKKAE